MRNRERVVDSSCDLDHQPNHHTGKCIKAYVAEFFALLATSEELSPITDLDIVVVTSLAASLLRSAQYQLVGLALVRGLEYSVAVAEEQHVAIVDGRQQA